MTEDGAPRVGGQDPRWRQLIGLIERLPADKAQILKDALVGGGLGNVSLAGFSDMMKALDLRAGSIRSGDLAGLPPLDTLMRRICRFLEPFLVNQPDFSSDGVIQRRTLMLWWDAAKEKSSELRRFEEEFGSAAKRDDKTDMDRLADATLPILLKITPKLILKAASGGIQKDIPRIVSVLSGGKKLADALLAIGIAGSPKPAAMISVDETLVEAFTAQYVKVAETGGFDLVWFGHGVMNRLKRQWQIVRLIHSVMAQSGTQVRLEETELSPLIDRAMADLAQLAAQASDAVKTAAKQRQVEAIEAAGRLVTAYFEASEDMASQIRVERESGWGRTYMSFRKSLADLLAQKIDDFDDVIVGFIEDWDEAGASDTNPQFIAAAAAADLLGNWKGRADRHGFQTAIATFERRTIPLFSRSAAANTTNAGKDLWIKQKKRLLLGLKIS